HGRCVRWIKQQHWIKRSNVSIAEELVVILTVPSRIECRATTIETTLHNVPPTCCAANISICVFVQVLRLANSEHFTWNCDLIFGNNLLPRLRAESEVICI